MLDLSQKGLQIDGCLNLGRSGLHFVRQANLYSKYAFYVDFADGIGRDRVSDILSYTNETHEYAWKNNYVDSPLLKSALNGVPDGTELVVNGDGSSIIGWDTASSSILSIVGGNLRVTNGAAQWGKIIQEIPTVIGQRYVLLCKLNIGTTTSGIVTYRLGTTSGGVQIVNVTIPDNTKYHSTAFTATSTSVYLGFVGNNVIGEYFEVESASIMNVLDATAEWEVEWTPNFNNGESSGETNIISANDNKYRFIRFNQDTSNIQAYDGTTIASIACSPVSGTKYKINLVYGSHLTAGDNKMQLFLNDIGGDVVDFIGYMPNTLDLCTSFGTTPNQVINSIKVLKNPKSAGWV